ncbi:hypothetical protein PAXINDRAFT_12263 [Paxillus involutus ATCC 200175]|uniref:Uncharacterized protein n=1 Tax=Paxillus involutus ATCC 200175 TaxID=664439 RepID=A0A0C9U764_PAXIN|nr:hypothetical protein PAXINDRAFT_12263 [Paxillus involutus ATCC 200175]
MLRPLQARKWLVTATPDRSANLLDARALEHYALRVTPGRHSFKDPNKLWLSAVNLTQWQRHNFGSAAVVDIKQSSTAVSTSVVIDKRKPTKSGRCARTVALLLVGSSFSGVSSNDELWTPGQHSFEDPNELWLSSSSMTRW